MIKQHRHHVSATRVAQETANGACATSTPGCVQARRPFSHLSPRAPPPPPPRPPPPLRSAHCVALVSQCTRSPLKGWGCVGVSSSNQLRLAPLAAPPRSASVGGSGCGTCRTSACVEHRHGAHVPPTPTRPTPREPRAGPPHRISPSYLLVRRDPLLVLDLRLDILNRVRALHLQGDGLPRQRLHKDLHPNQQPTSSPVRNNSSALAAGGGRAGAFL